MRETKERYGKTIRREEKERKENGTKGRRKEMEG